MSILRKSFAWSFAQRYFNLALSFITLPVLSRILTPEEVGVYSVGVAFVALAHVVRDFGVADYIIQERDLTRARIQTAFGVSLVIGWTIGVVLFALSVPISVLYEEPGLRDVMRVLGLNFFVIPFSLPVLALLRRNMAFDVRARVTMASSFAHAVASIGLAVAGFGYMSLAWASLIGVLTTAILAARHRPSGIGVWPKLVEWRRVASFGGIATVRVFLDVVGERAPDFVLGRMIGFSAVGLYSRGE
ncbi:MAG: lipopolysaccharide biosynthesis protein, partial [Alphaproteobacteria bacterium]